MKSAIAIAAHPDDIELMMAGTLLLLKEKGYEIHYINLSCGNVGTTEYDTETIKKIRLQEAQNKIIKRNITSNRNSTIEQGIFKIYHLLALQNSAVLF